MKVTLPKGTTILDLPGAPAKLAADTEVDIDVILSETDVEAGVEEQDVIAHDFVAANRGDLLPTLTHKSGDKTIAYSPSGNRVEQTAEAVKAAAKFADGEPVEKATPAPKAAAKSAAPKGKAAPAKKKGK